MCVRVSVTDSVVSVCVGGVDVLTCARRDNPQSFTLGYVQFTGL